MLETFELTTDKEELALLIDRHLDREMARMSFRRTLWLIAFYYMMGIRHFDFVDPITGTLRYKYLDNAGNFEFRSAELLSAVDRVSGLLTSLDCRPLIMRTGNSLSAIRQRAIAQLFADSLISEEQVDQVTSEFAYIYSLLGSCGITGSISDHPTIGLTADLSIVHPKEMFPFPSLGEDRTKVGGWIRQRMVPLWYLRKIYGARKFTPEYLQQMDYWVINAGETLDDRNPNTPIGTTSTLTYTTDNRHGQPGSGKEHAQEMGVALIRELWQFGARGTVRRYCITSGAQTIEDERDLDGLEIYCPIGFSRFMENGTFHGAGMFDLLFSYCREAEQMMAALFKNIRDLDRYGILVLPHGSFNASTALRDVGHGLRVFPWEPDPISEGFNPFAIQPHNSRDIPGRVSQFALEQIDRINPMRDLLREKGRVDSASALSFLDEQINRRVATPSNGLQQAFASVYRSIVAEGSRESVLTDRALPVHNLSTDLAGAVIDMTEMTVSFANNPLPHLSRLKFGIKQSHPRSEVARKTEAVELFKLFQGAIDFDSFMLFALKEGLDFALWSDEHISAFEMVTLNILSLYNDGVTPGKVILVPQMTKPDFQLRPLNAFMSSTTMSRASVEVQNEFLLYHSTLINQMGLTLPNAMPNPDDLAIVQQLEQQLSRSNPLPQLEGARR